MTLVYSTVTGSASVRSARARPAALAGFTLIELMVVLAIMTVLMAVVGPVAIKTIARSDKLSDVVRVRQGVAALKQRAFLSGSNYTFQLDNHRIYATTPDFGPQQQTVVVARLKRLSAHFKQLRINANGRLYGTLDLLDPRGQLALRIQGG